ncbi:MAG TPA: tellurite resistance TerB family protein [Acetobacteraceae bacterium]|jgi:tellurite resistance protein|nr:tellurite resistance TerB family protein [Acetobacteraceae bacterium]
MPALKALDPQEALVCTMVLVAAADGGLTDREIGVMVGLVQSLPVFHDFSSARLKIATETAVSLLGESEGLAHAARLICEALEPRLRETAYVLGCDVIAVDHHARPTELEMLEFVRKELGIDPLVARAFERAARARQQSR